MKLKAVFYHDAGCTVCRAAKSHIINALDSDRYEIEEVDLIKNKQLIPQAGEAGVKSIPALVIDGHAFHINHGADLNALF